MSSATSTTDTVHDSETSNSETSTVRRRSFKGMTLEQRRQMRRQQLMEAGLALYGTQGFMAVTVRAICQHARLTERYFYESFENPVDLFTAIYNDLIAKLLHEIDVASAQQNLTGLMRIEVAARTLLETIQADERMARILFMEAAVMVPSQHATALRSAVDAFNQLITLIIVQVEPRLAQAPTQLALLSTGLNGLTTQIIMRWVFEQFKMPLELVLETCMLVYRGVVTQWSATYANAPAENKEIC